MEWSNFNRLYLAAERRRIARDRLKKKGPHAFRADVLGGMTVLVHPSTKRPGYWQATFFARDGDPWGDSESASWVLGWGRRSLEQTHNRRTSRRGKMALRNLLR